MNEKILEYLMKYGGWLVAIVVGVIMLNSYIQTPQQISTARIQDLQSQINSNKELVDQLTKTIQNDLHTQQENIGVLRENQIIIREELAKIKAFLELKLK